MLKMMGTAVRVLKQLSGITKTFASRSAGTPSFTAINPKEHISRSSDAVQMPVDTNMEGVSNLKSLPPVPNPNG